MSSLPIHKAANTENSDDLATALKNGDKPDALDEHGQAPLHIIATKSFRNEATFPIILQLVEAKADLNLKNAQGLTPLQVAANSGWQDTIAFLLQHGATLNKEMINDKAMHVSCGDCKRVLKEFEDSNFHFTTYKYENPHWTKLEKPQAHHNHKVAGQHGDSDHPKHGGEGAPVPADAAESKDAEQLQGKAAHHKFPEAGKALKTKD